MRKTEVLERIRRRGLVPTVRVESERQALCAVDALGQAGILVAEVTMSMLQAPRILDRVISRFGHSMLIGAGTVLDPETARHCILAGAQFIVSPGLNLVTIEFCRISEIPIFAGALTPPKYRLRGPWAPPPCFL